MVQTNAIEIPPRETIEVLKTRLVGARSGRVTIEWVLNRQPARAWIDAFNDAVDVDRSAPSMVGSTYGRPLLMEEGTILWSVVETEMRVAVSAVQLAVARANLVIPDPLDQT